MPGGTDPAEEADAPAPPPQPITPEPDAPRPTSAEVLERAGVNPKPLNLNAEHQRRLNEAIVKQEETRAAQAGDDRSMRRKFAVGIAIAAGAQIVAADVVFVVYGAANSWTIPGSTVSAWLGATVAQVIAVAVVIVRSLFGSNKG